MHMTCLNLLIPYLVTQIIFLDERLVEVPNVGIQASPYVNLDKKNML